MKSKKTDFGKKLDTHDYPPMFHKHPFMLQLLHKTTDLITLRNWYVNSYLKKVINHQSKKFHLIDLGCGSGNILIPNSLKFPDYEFTGVDITESNIAVLNSFVKNKKLKNLKLLNADISDLEYDTKADIITLITVLQLVEKDEELLEKCCKLLKPGGTVIIYVPLAEKRFFGWYNKIFKKWFKDHLYENVYQTKNIYTKEKILTKIEQAGLQIEEAEITYGTFGKIYYELYSFLLHLFKKSIFYTPVISILIIMLLPLLLTLMLIDKLLNNAEGNGLIIKATKQ